MNKSEDNKEQTLPKSERFKEYLNHKKSHWTDRQSWETQQQHLAPASTSLCWESITKFPVKGKPRGPVKREWWAYPWGKLTVLVKFESCWEFWLDNESSWWTARAGGLFWNLPCMVQPIWEGACCLRLLIWGPDGKEQSLSLRWIDTTPGWEVTSWCIYHLGGGLDANTWKAGKNNCFANG